jgi:hypothetical protein
MKSRTFYSAIALFAGLLVLVGVLGFWGLTAQNPRALMSKGGQKIPTAAQFVPRQAPVMASLLARPDRLWQLRQVLTPSKQRYAAREEWQALKQTLADTLGWDYDTDVRPWLDEEVTFAVTTADIDHDPTNGLQAGYLTVLSCRDAAAAREALHVLWQQRAATGRNLIFETESGLSLIYDQKPTDAAFRGIEVLSLGDAAIDSLASVMVGDRYVLLANDPQVLRQAIATYQAPDVSLARATNYREAINTLPSRRIGWLYANVPNLLTWLGLEESSPTPVLATAGQKANFLFMSFRAFPEGLIGDTAITAAPGTTFARRQPPSKSVMSALRLLPAETQFATAGTNLSDLLTDLDETIGGYRLTQRSRKALLSFLSLPSTAIPAELLAPLQGEYALGTLPGTTPTWLLVTKVSQSRPFADVDAFAADQGITVSSLSLGDRDITVWTRLSLARTSPESPLTLLTQVVGVHTTVKGYEVLSNSLVGLQKVLGSLKENSLSNQPTFLELTKPLELSAGSLTYLDWPTLGPSLTRQLPWLRAIQQAGQPFTAHIGPIVLSGYGSNQSLQEGAVAIKLLESP